MRSEPPPKSALVWVLGGPGALRPPPKCCSRACASGGCRPAHTGRSYSGPVRCARAATWRHQPRRLAPRARGPPPAPPRARARLRPPPAPPRQGGLTGPRGRTPAAGIRPADPAIDRYSAIHGLYSQPGGSEFAVGCTHAVSGLAPRARMPVPTPPAPKPNASACVWLMRPADARHAGQGGRKKTGSAHHWAASVAVRRTR